MLHGVKPLRRETLQAQVQQNLRSLILQGELAPGESITVASIAAALGVSAMPVREAISRLMAMGALTVVSGRSIGVPRLGLEELADIRRVRLEVESVAVRWAVERADEGLEMEMKHFLEVMEKAEKKGEAREFIHANYDFHFTVYRHAGSAVLLDVLSNIWLRVNPHFHLLQRHGHYRVSNRQHRALFDAVVTRNPDAAVLALREDIDSAYEVLVESLRSSPADPPKAAGSD